MKRKIIAVAVVVALGIIGYAFGSTWETRTNAAGYLNDLLTIQPGKSTYDDAKAFAFRHHLQPSVRTPQCAPEKCDWDFVVENKALERVLLFSKVTFGATIKTEDGQVMIVSAGMEKQGRVPVYAHASERSFQLEGERSYTTALYRNEENLVYRVDVKLVPGVTAEERKRAFAFNLNCMVLPLLCRDARDLLPTVK